MRFSITIPDDLVDRIDQEAENGGVTRADWIRRACDQVLTGPAPEEHQDLTAEIGALTREVEYLSRTAADLREDRDFLRGEVARLVRENTMIIDRLVPPLPPARPGFWSRVRSRFAGDREG